MNVIAFRIICFLVCCLQTNKKKHRCHHILGYAETMNNPTSGWKVGHHFSPLHFVNHNTQFLNGVFFDRWLGRGDSIPWPVSPFKISVYVYVYMCVCMWVWGGGGGGFWQVSCVNIENHDCRRTYNVNAGSIREITLDMLGKTCIYI